MEVLADIHSRALVLNVPGPAANASPVSAARATSSASRRSELPAPPSESEFDPSLLPGHAADTKGPSHPVRADTDGEVRVAWGDSLAKQDRESNTLGIATVMQAVERRGLDSSSELRQLSLCSQQLYWLDAAMELSQLTELSVAFNKLSDLEPLSIMQRLRCRQLLLPRVTALLQETHCVAQLY